MNKLILTALLAANFFAIFVDAREFEIFVKGDGLRTLENTPVEEYKIVDIKGQYPDAVNIPTYGQIRKAIAESLHLDPHWKNFTIKYMTKSDSKFYFLKPHIEKLSRKDRAIFLDEIAKDGYKDMPVLIIAKRQPQEMKAGIGYRVTPQNEEKTMRDENEEMRIMPISTEKTQVPAEPTDMPTEVTAMPTTHKMHHNREEEMIIPEWLFDESLIGESDPILFEKLKMVSEKYE